ncbi:MAG: DNA topoisomerase I, partial [Gammaproteobacteria bacterium]|nr:DNA topoisomerase I [Gammaproteobacteria bacterium]
DKARNAKIPKDRDPKTLTLDECRELLAAAPQRAGRGRFGRGKTSAKAKSPTKAKAPAKAKTPAKTKAKTKAKAKSKAKSKTKTTRRATSTSKPKDTPDTPAA